MTSFTRKGDLFNLKYDSQSYINYTWTTHTLTASLITDYSLLALTLTLTLTPFPYLGFLSHNINTLDSQLYFNFVISTFQRL